MNDQKRKKPEMRQWKLWLWAGLLVAGATGCSGGMKSDDLPQAWDSPGISVPDAPGGFGCGAADTAVPEHLTLPSPEGRQMAYSVELEFRTVDIAAAISKAIELARAAGGYAVFVDDTSVRMRIPADRAEACLTTFESLGTLTSKSITGTDVTAEVVDVRVRLENLQRLRQNLQGLLERAAKVSELLEVERELARVTTEIERFEALQQNLALQVTYFDVTISFEAAANPAAQRNRIPLPWVAELGSELWSPALPLNDRTRKPFEFTLPDGFAVIYADDDTFYAMSPDEITVKCSRHPNRKGATLEFWNELIQRSLKARGFETSGGVRQPDAEGRKSAWISCSADADDALWSYQLLVFADNGGWFSDGHVYTVECWGPAEKILAAIDREKLDNSVRF